MPVAASAIYFLNLRGDVLINRLYRDDVGANMVDAFRTCIMQTKELGTCPVLQIGGCSYLYMRISNVYIVIVVSSNANVACAFEFVVEAVALFKSYFGGAFDEDAIRNNSVLIYELLDEIMDFGYPQNLSPEILKLYITQGVRSPLSSKLIRPHLSRADAMWCLLMSDLHVRRASSIEIPVIPLNIGNKGLSTGAAVSGSVESLTGRGVVAPALCQFHGGWGFGNGGGLEFPVNGFSSCGTEMTLQREIEGPKRFNLSPSMKSLKRNVTMFAAGFLANSKQLQLQSQTCQIALSLGNANIVLGAEAPVQQSEESLGMKNQEVVNSVLSKFRELKLKENWVSVAEDQMDEMIAALLHQVKDLERQVKDRKEWAHEKAMQAARKLCHDLTELKMLRMEQEETQRLKEGKQTLEDTTMKRLSEMESALRKASGQVDRSNAAVRQLETENAEIRAEMEASKLSASESVRTCLEAAKREKKYLKKLLAWEKQKAKLQEEIADEKEKILELQQHVVRIKQSQKEVELKWRQEVKAKEVVFTQVEEERQSKEVAEASTKRKLEALRLKIEIDFQRHKDDLQRLKQELSRLKVSAQFTELNHPSNTLSTPHNEGAKPRGETITKLLHDVYGLEDPSDKEINCDRECMICMKEEVSIVFLPCAHQVLCANCSDSYGKKGRVTCPCCRVPIEQRIRVYGASS